jgi:type II secretory pathway pseudopilin PulG
MRSNAHGSALLESMAAVAIAGLLSAGWANVLVRQTRTMTEIRDLSRTLTIARNILVHAASAGCAPVPVCPREKSCRTMRTPLRGGSGTYPPLVRLEVAVSSRRHEAPAVRLTTLAYSGGMCG